MGNRRKTISGAGACCMRQATLEMDLYSADKSILK